MGFREMVERDTDNVFFNTSEFAQTVTHWPGGDSGSATSITGVFIPEESRRELVRGEEIVRPAVLWVDDTATITAKDVFVIDGSNYQTLKFDAVEYGARRIEVQRNDKDHTSRPSGGTLL